MYPRLSDRERHSLALLALSEADTELREIAQNLNELVEHLNRIAGALQFVNEHGIGFPGTASYEGDRPEDAP